MTTINLADKTIGNIKYTVAANVSEEMQKALLEEGLTRILQGPVATEWEKGAIALTFPHLDKDGKQDVVDRKSLEAAIKAGTFPPFVDEDGKERKFTRTDIPFTDAVAALWQNCCKGAEFEIGRNEKDEAVKEDVGIETVLTEEYTPGAGAAPKYAAEKKHVRDYLAANGGKLKTGEPRTPASFCASRGLTAPTEPWEEDTTFLVAVRTYLASLAADE